MTFRRCWDSAGTSVIAATFAVGLLVASPAHAIFLEADSIDASGSFSTVDLWFFSFNANSTATIQVNDLGGPPVIGADPDLIIYLDDGTLSNVFASDTAAGTDPAITDLFPAGSYIGVVANHLLEPGQFGPTLSDLTLAVGGYDYEFNGPEPQGGEIVINCVLSGNLAGDYTKRVLATDTCQLPPTRAVTEPATAAFFFVALMWLCLIPRLLFDMAASRRVRS